jgi:hypothetical protein
MKEIELYKDKVINRRVSRLPEVRAEVAETALNIGVDAEARLLRHRDTTNSTDHRIEVEQGRVDSYVYLVGPAAYAIEMGHVHNHSKKWVNGIYAISGAAGLI